MKFQKHVVAAVILLFILAAGVQASTPKRDLLNSLDFPVYSGAVLVKGITVPAGPILDGLEKEIGASLPVSSIKEVNVASYSIDPSIDGQKIVEFYDPVFTAQQWKTLVRTVDRSGDVTVILTNDKEGMLIIDVDPQGEDRELSFVLVSGTVDTSKIDKRFAEKAGELVSGKIKPGIPVGTPISVPPSGELCIQSTRSNIAARFGSQNTVEVAVSSRPDTTGEMTRTSDGRLLLTLAPMLDVDELSLPTNVPVTLESTDGSITLSGGVGGNASATRLGISSTGAAVKLESLPLTSGSYNVKVLGKSIDASLSEVVGGSLAIEVQGGDVTITLPANASVSMEVSVISGEIHNSATTDAPSGDKLSFRMGDGKAQITIKAVNGSVNIKTS